MVTELQKTGIDIMGDIPGERTPKSPALCAAPPSTKLRTDFAKGGV